MNLLEETKEILRDNKKSLKDVKWFGSYDLEIVGDIEDVFDIEYDECYGAQEIPKDLIVVGKGFWLEREEYDGSEWWVYKSMPLKPRKKIENPSICGSWVSLEDLNKDKI